MVDREHPGPEAVPSQSGAERAPDPLRLDDEISLVEIVDVFLRQRVLVFSAILLFAVISLVVALTRPTLYTSLASFVPESSGSGASGALALAQQFGFSTGNIGGGGERSPQFYEKLVTSREILRQAVTRRYPLALIEEGVEETDLVTFYAVPGATDEERIERAMVSLREALNVSTDGQTGIVSFSATTPDPKLSMGVVAFIFERVNDFDLTTRRSHATAEKLFSGERLTELKGELLEAEDSLKNFYLDNRLYSDAPLLLVEHDRLQREVRMRQELVNTLAQAFESARIEEVRNTPVITLIESPRVPAIRDPKRRTVIVLVGTALGGVLGVFLAFVRDHREQGRRKEDAGLDELTSA